MGKTESETCKFCKECPETIEHTFWSCHKITAIWEELNQWINQKTNQELPLNFRIILFGQWIKSEKKICTKPDTSIFQTVINRNELTKEN